MKFFGKDLQQDKHFVEIRNILELVHWVAGDADNFIEFFKELINKNNLSTAINNLDKSKELLISTKEKIKYQLSGEHLDCAQIIYDYTEFCVSEFDIKQSDTTINENDDIKLTRMFDAEDSFRLKYFPYITQDVEYYRLRSYSEFSRAAKEMIAFNPYMDDSDVDVSEKDHIEKKRKEILEYFRVANYWILRSNQDLNRYRSGAFRKSDYGIACGTSGLFSPEYHQLQVEYNLIWQGIVDAQKEFFTQICDINSDADEINFLDFHSKQFLSSLNLVGFKINKFILDTMKIEIPEFQLLSPKTIQNQLQFLNA